MPALKKKFLTYKDFGIATITDIVDTAQAYKKSVVDLESCYLENLGNGKFDLHPLPWQAQLAPLYGMQACDVDEDGYLDLVVAGNDYGAEPSVGHIDALNGLVLRGDGKGHFSPLSMGESGLYLPGNAKSLVRLRRGGDGCLLAASQHGGPLQVFSDRRHRKLVSLLPGDRCAHIFYKDGAMRKEEYYMGGAFMGQSANFIECSRKMLRIEITDKLGRIRKVMP